MWFPLAILAAGLWGVSYALSEWLYERISVLTLLAIEFSSVAILFAILSAFFGDWKKDWVTISSPKTLLFLLTCILTLAAAELCINFSISEKNATIASLIELSYPLFVIAASYAIFRTTHLSIATAFGGALVFAGVAVIYIFNR